MAFNPFHNFRKHQKVVFAGLTIVCMLTFVLSSGMGKGDFFDTVSSWFSNRSREKDAVTLYGKSVSAPELDLLREQRLIANTYMLSATQAALARRANEILSAVKKRDPQKPDPFGGINELQQDPVLNQLMDRLGYPTDQSNRFILAFNIARGQIPVPDPKRFSFFGDLVTSEQSRPGQLDSLLDFLIWKQQADKLNIHLSDADVKKEIARLTLDKFTEQDSISIQQSLRSNHRIMTESLLTKALNDEFRVRLARAALEGYEPGTRSEVPAPVTPEEFWEFYRNNRTEIEVALFPITVRELTTPEIGASLIGFASQPGLQPLTAATAAMAGVAPSSLAFIKDKPTDKELQALYRKKRTDGRLASEMEPSPESDQPGFRQPARVQVQWVSARTDAPEYRKQARQLLTLVPSVRDFLSSVPLGPGPGAVGWAAVQNNLSFNAKVDLLAEYENSRRSQFAAPSWTDPNFALSFISSLPPKAEPAEVASLVGLAVGATGTQSTPVLAAAGHQSALVARRLKTAEPFLLEEAKQRLPVGATLILNSANPLSGPALGAWYGAALAPKLPADFSDRRFLPLEMVRSQVAEEVEQKLGREVAVAALQNFYQKELADVVKEYDRLKKPLPKDLYQQLEAKAKKAGLLTGMNSEPENRYVIVNDPALRPIKEAFLRERRAEARPMDRELTEAYAQLFFPPRDAPFRLYEAAQVPSSSRQSGQPPISDMMWKRDIEPVLFWKIKEEPATTLPWDKVRDQLVAAWKLDKARERAQEEAKRLAAAVEARKAGLKSTSDAARREKLLKELRDLASKQNVQMLDPSFLGPVAPFLEKRQAFLPPPGTPPDYEPFAVPRDKIAYAGPEFVKQLLTLKDKDVGSTVVLADQPREVYYVAALIERLPVSLNRFAMVYRTEAAPAPPLPEGHPARPMTLLTRMELERQHQYRKDAIEQLRAQAGLTATNPSAEFRKKFSGGSEGASE